MPHDLQALLRLGEVGARVPNRDLTPCYTIRLQKVLLQSTVIVRSSKPFVTLKKT